MSIANNRAVLTSFMPRIVLIVPVCLALILCAGDSTAAVTVDIVAVANTTLFSAYPGNNFGTSMIATGANGVGQPGRGLIQFDLSSIPSGATITDALITMQVVKVPPADQHAGLAPSNFGLYAMLVPWVAGTGGGPKGVQANVGESTWNERLAGITSWGAPGGLSGTDFVDTPSTSAFVGTDTALYYWAGTPQVLSDLQSWVTDASTNHGYLMMSDGEDTAGTARRLASIQTAGPSDVPPTLSVTYTTSIVPEPDCVLLIAVATCFAGAMIRRRRAT